MKLCCVRKPSASIFRSCLVRDDSAISPKLAAQHLSRKRRQLLTTSSVTSSGTGFRSAMTNGASLATVNEFMSAYTLGTKDVAWNLPHQAYSNSASPKQTRTVYHQIPLKSYDTITHQTQFWRVIFLLQKFFRRNKMSLLNSGGCGKGMREATLWIGKHFVNSVIKKFRFSSQRLW